MAIDCVSVQRFLYILSKFVFVLITSKLNCGLPDWSSSALDGKLLVSFKLIFKFFDIFFAILNLK